MNSYTGKDCDTAYRRGFDQAIAILLVDCGVTEEQIEKLLYKKRVAKWRSEAKGWTYELRKNAPRMTKDEATKLVSYMNSGFWDDQGDISDA